MIRLSSSGCFDMGLTEFSICTKIFSNPLKPCAIIFADDIHGCQY